MCMYSLKPAKDLEQAPFSVLPHADNIQFTTVNSQTNLIAFGLINHCISVWNRYIGQPLKVFLPFENQDITMLHFSSVYHGTLQSRLTYATENGKLWQVTCERNDITEPVCLDDRSSSLFEDDIVLLTVPGPMNLLTTIWKSGQVVIYNEASSLALCQLESFNEDCGVKANMNQLQLAYAKEYILAVRDESTNEKDSSRLFLFEPDEYPILQPFFHNVFSMDEEQEKVDNLEKNFLQFLRRRRLSDDSLHARIATQRRELLCHRDTLPVET